MHFIKQLILFIVLTVNGSMLLASNKSLTQLHGEIAALEGSGRGAVDKSLMHMRAGLQAQLDRRALHYEYLTTGNKEKAARRAQKIQALELLIKLLDATMAYKKSDNKTTPHTVTTVSPSKPQSRAPHCHPSTSV